MNKLLRVFSSQIFNSFFPLLIVAILLHIPNKHESASIFIIINFANIYLLFSDYSSNIRFIKEAMNLGGVRKNPPPEITDAIGHYIGIKVILLTAGFIPWIIIAYITPGLHQHLGASIAGYGFIVAYNFNFYWVYTASNKEYFFILSNFFSRMAFVVILLLFIYFKLNNSYLMFLAGLLSSVISLFFFYRFCKVYQIRIRLHAENLKYSIAIILSDFRLVASNFMLMAPTLSLTFSLGYIQQQGQIAIYAIAEKIFLGIRTLLSIAISSIYPVLCNGESFAKFRIYKMLILFYISITGLCAATYFLSPYITLILEMPAADFTLFHQCLGYFLLVIIVISINAPFMLWLMLSNELQSKRTLFTLTVAALIIIGLFICNIYFFNTAVSLVQSLLIGESIIVLGFLILYKSRRPDFASQTIIPTV